MRGMLFTLISTVCSAAVIAGTTVYKWVDENGVTHYSDQPHENAAKVNVRDPTTYSAARGPSQAIAETNATASQPAGERATGYDSCALAQPTPDQVFLNSFSVTVVVQTVPALHPGDRVIVTLDGRPLPNASGGTQVTLDSIDRGTHSVEATIQDQNGQTVCQTGSSTFHVRQPSLLSPNRPKS